MSRLGFTGTRRGMTMWQQGAVKRLAASYDEVHHGDCLGSDADMHAIARVLQLRVVVHPPVDDRLRAGCTGNVNRPVKPYHDRNRDIVDETEHLIATPDHMTETGLGGTWWTVRYARSVGKPVTVVWPNGRASTETPANDKQEQA
jgi:hypothetical protein